jgi:hypothetical protein
MHSLYSHTEADVEKLHVPMAAVVAAKFGDVGRGVGCDRQPFLHLSKNSRALGWWGLAHSRSEQFWGGQVWQLGHYCVSRDLCSAVSIRPIEVSVTKSGS